MQYFYIHLSLARQKQKWCSRLFLTSGKYFNNPNPSRIVSPFLIWPFENTCAHSHHPLRLLLPLHFYVHCCFLRVTNSKLWSNRSRSSRTVDAPLFHLSLALLFKRRIPFFLDLNRPSRSKVINNFVFEFEYGNVRAVALAVEKLFVIPGWGVSYCDVMWCYDYIWCVMWKRTKFWWLLIIWGVTMIVSIILVLYYLKVMLLLEHIEQNKYIF